MWKKLWIVFYSIPELSQKILLTLGLLAVYRAGFHIPLPIVNQELMKQNLADQAGTDAGGMGHAIQVMELFSGTQMYTIFGLGIMPYISTSIIFQLFTTVVPYFEKLSKEGEAGRRKINELTRYFTVILAFGQSYMWIRVMAYSYNPSPIISEFNDFSHHILAALTMTAGTILLMWIGEQIDAFGVGNGISLLIMAGILGRFPKAIGTLLSPALSEGVNLGSKFGVEKLMLLAVLFVGVIWAVVAITQGQRRIPTQSAKHVRGRRVYGHRQFLPLRVNQAGVMPIIFASSLLMFPLFLFQFLSGWFPQSTFLRAMVGAFGSDRGFIYNLCYVGLIYFFCYFWTAVTFNPKEMANQLKDYGSFIPGIRPGKQTATYLEKVMVRITYVGAAFLAIVAVTPTMVAGFMTIDMVTASFFGGTGLLIVVSVALDLVQKIDSHLVMRNYKGLLEREET